MLFFKCTVLSQSMVPSYMHPVVQSDHFSSPPLSPPNLGFTGSAFMAVVVFYQVLCCFLSTSIFTWPQSLFFSEQLEWFINTKTRSCHSLAHTQQWLLVASNRTRSPSLVQGLNDLGSAISHQHFQELFSSLTPFQPHGHLASPLDIAVTLLS